MLLAKNQAALRELKNPNRTGARKKLDEATEAREHNFPIDDLRRARDVDDVDDVDEGTEGVFSCFPGIERKERQLDQQDNSMWLDL